MKKYSIIYADPPWRYKVYSKKGLGRSAESHYPTMELEDIRALPVGTLAADDCVLFLWTTIPLLHDCFSVMRAWGFSYKTVAFVWITLGGILMGGMHDFFSGVLSLRHGGESLPGLTGRYLGDGARRAMSLFTVALLVLLSLIHI